MSHDSSLSPLVVSGSVDIEKILKEALARLRVTDIYEIEKQFAANGGNLEIDSQEAVTVLASAEGVLKRTLPGLEKLKPSQPTSLRALCELIEQHLESLANVDTKVLERQSSAE